MDWYTLVGVVCGIGGFIVAWLTFRYRQKQKDEEGGISRGIIQSDIGYIKAGIDDLKRDGKESRNMIVDLSERVARVDESVKQAHKRIDKLDKDD